MKQKEIINQTFQATLKNASKEHISAALCAMAENIAGLVIPADSDDDGEETALLGRELVVCALDKKAGETLPGREQEDLLSQLSNVFCHSKGLVSASDRDRRLSKIKRMIG